MKSKFKYFLLTLWTLLLSAHNLQNYKAVNYCGTYDNKNISVIRDFIIDGNKNLLVVDNNSLQTKIIPKTRITKTECDNNSEYKKLLKLSHLPPYPLQNDGIINIGNGIHITTDMCPSSKKGYEQRLYIGLAKYLKRPVPVTIFVSGRWIKKHPKAFDELLDMQKDGNLSIIWGNHTYRHIYHPHKSLKQNFVLSPEERFIPDILDLEKLLISKGLTPSVFFRFPGLVSDKKTIEEVAKLGLITIGSDAWLAKGQKPKNGSIILVHGNKNEPKGVDILLNIIKKGINYNNTLLQCKKINIK